MQLSVKGKQLDVGDALRTYVDESLSRILGKYFGDAIEVDVTISRDSRRFGAVVAAHVGRGIRVEAHGESEQPYPAIDMAAERLSKRLRRHKRRLRSHRKEDGPEHEPLAAQSYILAGEEFDESDFDDDAADGGVAAGVDGQPVVIAEMTTEIPSLTVSDAVMRMDLADVSAYMFRNSAHGGLNMVYRRQDGNIGWIDPRGNRNA